MQMKRRMKAMIIIGLFVVVLVMYIAVILYKHAQQPNKKEVGKDIEHFTEGGDAVSEDKYKARLAVMTVFEGHAKRKPTPEEIEKYSKYENEQDILTAVLQDTAILKDASNIEDSKQLPLTSLVKPEQSLAVHEEEYFVQEEEIMPKYDDIVREEVVYKSASSFESYENPTEVTISREYLSELKKQVKRLELELSSFRKILG